MNTKTTQPILIVLQRWREKDREIESRVDEIRVWMHQVSQLGIPHFGETATRLRPLRMSLQSHFANEDEVVTQLAELYPSASPEVNAVKRQSSRDHSALTSRLDDLIDRLDQPDPPFLSWQAAIDELESFVGALEQHEDQESESFEMLIPAKLRPAD